MKLKELDKDIERYLQEDCYLPNEVYDITGFFFMHVYADSDCELLGKYKYEDYEVMLVATYAGEHENPILLTVWMRGEAVTSMERYDLTEHNIQELKAVLSQEKEYAVLSEYDELLKSTQKILSIADAICIN